MDDVLTLIKESITTDKYGREVIEESERVIFCKVDSISQNEFFNASDAELNPEYRFTVFFGDYEKEDLCEFHGVRYSIYRTYRDGDDLELYVERKIGA